MITNKQKQMDQTLLDKIQLQSIIPSEIGIINKGGVGFHLSSSFAKEHLFYISWEGLYDCDSRYRVEREHIDALLVLQVMEGTMGLTYFGRNYTLSEGSILIINLRNPHAYYSKSEHVRCRQMQIHGPQSLPYYYLLTNDETPLIYENNSKMGYLMYMIEELLAKDFPDEHQLSLLIHSIFISAVSQNTKKITSPVERSKDYIREHYKEDITLDMVANHVSLNKSYLSRLFKKETHTTPWDFLINLRLRHAMHLLTTTLYSIEEIACQCGFNSTSHFIRCFKGETGSTPKQFRSFYISVPMSTDILRGTGITHNNS